MSHPRTLLSTRRWGQGSERRPSEGAAARPVSLTKPDLTALVETRYNEKSKRTEKSSTHNALGCLEGVLEATGVCHALKDEGFGLEAAMEGRTEQDQGQGEATLDQPGLP